MRGSAFGCGGRVGSIDGTLRGRLGVRTVVSMLVGQVWEMGEVEGRSGEQDVEGKNTDFEVDVGGWGRGGGVGG